MSVTLAYLNLKCASLKKEENITHTDTGTHTPQTHTLVHTQAYSHTHSRIINVLLLWSNAFFLFLLLSKKRRQHSLAKHNVVVSARIGLLTGAGVGGGEWLRERAIIDRIRENR